MTQQVRPGMATSKREFVRKYGGWIAGALVMWAILIFGIVHTFWG